MVGQQCESEKRGEIPLQESELLMYNGYLRHRNAKEETLFVRYNYMNA